MASGNTLFYANARGQVGPGASAAQFDVIAGTSTPPEAFPVIAFDTSIVEYADFRGKMPQHYGGNGVTLHMVSSATTTTGGIVFAVAFRALKDDAEDLDSVAHTYVYKTVTISPLASAIGELTYDTLAFLAGAEMDNVVAGDEFVLRVRRDTGNASDTATGDAHLHSVELRET
jgi:hypothetical protein